MINTPSTRSTVAPAADSEPLLDAERLDVYAVALQFQGLAAVLDVLRHTVAASGEEANQGRSLLVRMVQMLTRLDQSLR